MSSHAHNHHPAGHGHSHGPGHHHAPRSPTARPEVRVGGSALRASLLARFGVAAVLCAAMWGGVMLVIQP
ncbi:hypothetical protein ACLBXM_10490 [Xanthobacteraceae bacterium A53D]